METTVKHLSDTKVQLKITTNAKELADAESVALVKLSKTVKVPGFRDGKVPASVAAKHVDQQVLQDQTMDDAISRAIADAFATAGLRPLDRPTVEVQKFVPGELLEFTAEVEILPEVKVGDYKRLTSKPAKVTVSAKEVDEIIDRMRASFADKNETDRAAKTGDEVLLDFVGKKDGLAFDGGTATDYSLILGSNQFIPGFEEGIVGHKPGESFDLNLKFPADYHASELAGADVVFTVTLKKVIESTLPAVDDELAKKAGPFETLAELKADIKRELTAQKEWENNEQFKDDLITELIEKSEVPVPEILFSDQLRSIEQDFQQNLNYRGLQMDAYLNANNFKDIEDWREKEAKPVAIRRVQAGLVLSEVTKAENIQPTMAELDAHVEVHKQQYANDPEALKQFETEEVRRDIANHFITEQTIERLVELNR